MTILGTRPELIRLSLIIPKLDKLCDHVLVHTGQNYDTNLNDIFLKQLDIREPNYQLQAVGTFGEQISTLMEELEDIIGMEQPDAFLVLGDTNSSLGAILAKRMGVRVFHMEAGNRCHDDRVPEEVNRRIIDHSSDILLPYTERSRDNLIREGIPNERIYVTGNPIGEVLDHFNTFIEDSQIMNLLELEAGEFFLVTLHRAENVDNSERLKKFVEALNLVAAKHEKPIIWPVHPRTKPKLEGMQLDKSIKITEPLGLFDFVRLESLAYCVLTDSGTVQEECSILLTPVVTMRDSTERPETLETGSNFIAGCEPESILLGVETVTEYRTRESPPEYMCEDVSNKIVKIVLSYYS